MTRKPSFSKVVGAMEENRTPVGRPDFKSGERRKTSLVGSTPTLFRQTEAVISLYSKPLGLKKRPAERERSPVHGSRLSPKTVSKLKCKVFKEVLLTSLEQ